MELNAHLNEFGALAEYLAPEKREVYRRINFEYLLLINSRKPPEMQSILWDGIQSNLINRRNSFEGSQNGSKMSSESLQTSIALTQFLPKFNSHAVVESIAPVQSLQMLATLSRDVSLALSGSAVSGELTEQAMTDLREALNGDRAHSKWLLIAAYKQIHKAIKLYPPNYRAQFAYAWLNTFFFRKPEKAEKHFEAVISNAFETDIGFTVFTLRHLAEVRRDLGKFSAAVEAANEAFMLDQQRTLQIQFELARYLTLDGQHSKALGYLEDLLVDHPEFYWQALAEPDFSENVEIVVLLNALSRAYLELDENFDHSEYEHSIDEAELAEVLDENARVNQEIAAAVRQVELDEIDTAETTPLAEETATAEPGDVQRPPVAEVPAPEAESDYSEDVAAEAEISEPALPDPQPVAVVDAETDSAPENVSGNIAQDSVDAPPELTVDDSGKPDEEKTIIVRSAQKEGSKKRNGNGHSHKQPEPLHERASLMENDTAGEPILSRTDEVTDEALPDEDVLFEDNTEKINQLLQRIRSNIYRENPESAEKIPAPDAGEISPESAGPDRENAAGVARNIENKATEDAEPAAEKLPGAPTEVEKTTLITSLEDQLADISDATLTDAADAAVSGENTEERAAESAFEDSPEAITSNSELVKKIQSDVADNAEAEPFSEDAQSPSSPESPLSGLLQRIGQNIRETPADEEPEELLPVDDIELPESELLEKIQSQPQDPSLEVSPESNGAAEDDTPELIAKIADRADSDLQESSADLTSEIDIEAEGAALIAQIEQYARENLTEHEIQDGQDAETDTHADGEPEVEASDPAEITMSSLLQLVEQNATQNTEDDMFKTMEQAVEKAASDTKRSFANQPKNAETTEFLPAGVTEAADEIRHEMELAIQRCEMLDSFFTRKDKQRTQSQIRDIADDAVEMLPKMGDMERQKEVKITKKRLQQQVDFFVNRHRIISRIKKQA